MKIEISEDSKPLFTAASISGVSVSKREVIVLRRCKVIFRKQLLKPEIDVFGSVKLIRAKDHLLILDTELSPLT